MINKLFWKSIGCAMPALIVIFTFNTRHPYVLAAGLGLSIVIANAAGYVEGALKTRGITL